MSVKKYQRNLDRELESAGYALQRTKRHRIYYNAELGKTITASCSPRFNSQLREIRRHITRQTSKSVWFVKSETYVTWYKS